MADGGLDAQGFTVKDWLQRIDAKQDKLDEKIDAVSAAMDRKADDRDVRALTDRILVLEQQGNQRLDLWKKLDGRVDTNTGRIDDLKEDKADRVDVAALWRVLVGALSGSAIAILAWALTLFAR
jgi:predicted  nucleic acid-binding Zn-ribbon protein